MKFILEDIGSRAELAFRWIYEEYAVARQMTRNPADHTSQNHLQRYDDCLTKFIRGFIDHPEYREGSVINSPVIIAVDWLIDWLIDLALLGVCFMLFLLCLMDFQLFVFRLVSALYLEVPVITDGAVELLNYYCTVRNLHGGMRLIQKLVASRSNGDRFIIPALEMTLYNRKDIQAQAVQTCVKVYETVPELRETIRVNRRLYNTPSIDWLIDWLLYWLVDWLIDWLIGFFVIV